MLDAWPKVRAQAEQLLTSQQRWKVARAKAKRNLEKFNPFHEPGGSGHGGEFAHGEGGGTVEGFKPGILANKEDAAVKATKERWYKESPFKGKSATEVQAVASKMQDQLIKVGKQIEKDVGGGVLLDNPGVKKNIARIEKKAKDREGKIERVGDITRAGFIINSPAQADLVAAELAKHYEIAAEDWKVTDVGYTDKVLQIRFPNGLIGEVQLKDRAMDDAKMKQGGHDLYEAVRELDKQKEEARVRMLNSKMESLYKPVLENYPPDWRTAIGPQLDQFLARAGSGGK